MNGPKTKLSPSSNLHTFSLSFEVWICYPKEACFLEFIANHNPMCHGLEIDTCKNLPIAPLQMCSFRIKWIFLNHKTYHAWRVPCSLFQVEKFCFIWQACIQNYVCFSLQENSDLASKILAIDHFGR
jgi:hypothetical protein